MQRKGVALTPTRRSATKVKSMLVIVWIHLNELADEDLQKTAMKRQK